MTVNLAKIPFVKARNFTETGEGGRRVDLLVDHLMVIPEVSDAAERIAQMFHTTTREASAHYNVDNNSIVQGVRDEDIAWAAPGANSDGIQIEQAGTLQTPAQWKDRYSLDMLENSCQLKAALAKKHGIPVVWCDVADLKAGRRGITQHWHASVAFRLSTHTDCGVNYPIEKVIELTREMVDHDHNKHAKPDKPDLPSIEQGDVGWLVKKAQKHLNAHGFDPRDADEDKFGKRFDERMEQMVRRFQRDVGLKVDGVVGPLTWRKLRR
jgi:murein L,D-transpeptidase YcbB/YkuD